MTVSRERPSIRLINRYKVPATAVFALSCLVTTACTAEPSSTKQPTTVETVYAPPQTPKPQSSFDKSISLTPDMTGFLQDPSHCARGGARPCALLLRTKPQLSQPYINANPDDARVDYPLEAYSGQPGDQLKAVCIAPEGDAVSYGRNDTASSVWYGVLVEPQYIKNIEVEQAFTNEQDTVQAAEYHGATYLLGYASIKWFHQSQPAGNLPDCS